MLFNLPEATAEEQDVIGLIDEIRDGLKSALRTPHRWYGLLRRNLHARNIRASNAIGGHNVTMDDAVAALESEEPFDAKGVDWQAVVGYRETMTYVLQLAKRPRVVYSAETLCCLHYMMLKYDLSKNPGNWRPGPVSVHDAERREIVYEGPDAELVPRLIEELVAWLNTSNSPALLKAAMAHLNLVLIHPFSDGNGRMSRCLQSLVLASHLTDIDPNFVSIEACLGRTTRVYYNTLGEVAKGRWEPGNDARPWIRFCLTAHYQQGVSLRRRMRMSHKLWGELENLVEGTQLPERTILALFDAGLGFKVRNATYRKAADVSAQIASRDLTALTKAGLLEMKGKARGAVYLASEQVRVTAARCVEPKIIEDPFEIVSKRPRNQLDLFGAK